MRRSTRMTRFTATRLRQRKLGGPAAKRKSTRVETTVRYIHLYRFRNYQLLLSRACDLSHRILHASFRPMDRSAWNNIRVDPGGTGLQLNSISKHDISAAVAARHVPTHVHALGSEALSEGIICCTELLAFASQCFQSSCDFKVSIQLKSFPKDCATQSNDEERRG